MWQFSGESVLQSDFEIALDADEAAVEEAVASVKFVDVAVKPMIGSSAEKYNAFKSWANGIAGGEAMAITSPYAAVSYLFGSTAVFKAEPKVEIESVAMKEPAGSIQGQTINMGGFVLIRSRGDA